MARVLLANDWELVQRGDPEAAQAVFVCVVLVGEAGRGPGPPGLGAQGRGLGRGLRPKPRPEPGPGPGDTRQLQQRRHGKQSRLRLMWLPNAFPLHAPTGHCDQQQ